MSASASLAASVARSAASPVNGKGKEVVRASSASPVKRSASASASTSRGGGGFLNSLFQLDVSYESGKARKGRR
jgi:hypothetical protein